MNQDKSKLPTLLKTDPNDSNLKECLKLDTDNLKITEIRPTQIKTRLVRLGGKGNQGT